MPSSQKLLEEYLIDGTADLQALLNNNGIIIENGPQWKETLVGCSDWGRTSD